MSNKFTVGPGLLAQCGISNTGLVGFTPWQEERRRRLYYGSVAIKDNNEPRCYRLIAPDLSHEGFAKTLRNFIHWICNGNIHDLVYHSTNYEELRSKCFNFKSSQLKSINWEYFLYRIINFVPTPLPFAVKEFNWPRCNRAFPCMIAWSILVKTYFLSESKRPAGLSISFKFFVVCAFR